MPRHMSSLVDQLVAAGQRRTQAGADWQSAVEFDAALASLRLDHHGAAPDDGPDPLAGVADVFGLDAVDASLLWLSAAGDLDANVGIAFALLRGVPGTARPSVALGLELCGVPTAHPDGFARLGPNGPLRRHGLVDIAGPEPWLGRALRVPDPVVTVLAGGAPSDPVVSRLRTTAVPLTLPGGEVIARAVDRGVPFVWVRSVQGSAGISLAAGALASLGLGCLAVDLRLHLSDQSLSDVTAAAAREAGLSGAALLVAGAEVITEANDRGALEVLERAAVPVVAVANRAWNPSWLRRLPLLIDAETLPVTARAAVWQSNLGEFADQDVELQQTLLGLRLTPEAVTEAARYARVLASAKDEPVSSAIVREAARRVGGSGSSGGDAITTGAAARMTFDDLVLPDHAAASLRQLVSWARHRDVVAAQGTMRKGRGLAALFAGSPGTGKTLAAHVVADELSVDLFQVDLSAIVDKYIGETEKNLEKVFQAAEALDVVLFFDEADALFGSRSEVRDARDRYANQEIAYLLQRMEHFDGITILATNLRGNLDRAFSRRMSFIVNFPDPDAPIRRRLWEHHLQQLTSLDESDPVQLDFLAESVELTGGDIRNIVLAAAYDAVSAAEPVGMRHIVESAVSEYRKLGRVVPEHGFVVASQRSPSKRQRPR
ncbi:MAG: ATP-binding protein [Pseudonocardiales bacterium]|nr:ATP-binding protein [Pseudonocardiales bacterium]